MEIDGESRPWRQGRAHESRACALLGRRSGPLKRITVETIALSDRGVDCYGLFSTVTRLEDNVTVGCGMTWLRQILLASAVVAQTASVNPHRQEQPVLLEEGDFVSESELARELPADKDHPLTRKLIAAEEGEISCEPTPQKILVAHYRAEPTAQFSMRDDRILIAVKRDDGFEILKVLPI